VNGTIVLWGNNVRSIMLTSLLLFIAITIPLNTNAQSSANSEDTSIDAIILEAEQGIEAAQHNLGVIYQYGEGVSVNKQLAAMWYKKASEQGNAFSQYNLGLMYLDGDGVTKNNAAAAKWFRKSAEQGFNRAQYNLGVLYDRGRGVREDNIKAYMWNSLAKSQGNKSAKEAEVYLRSKLSHTDLSRAKSLAKTKVKNLTSQPALSSTPKREDVLNLTRYVTGSSLNYRNSPNGVKLGSFAYTTKLVVYERIGKWVRVSRSNESDKWVHESYLSNSKPKPKQSVGSVSGDPLASGTRGMSMSGCKSSVYSSARYRGVSVVKLVDTNTAFIARVPSSNGYAYDFVTCSRPDRKRIVKRIKT